MKLQSHSVLNSGLLQETHLAALEGYAFIHFCFVGIQWETNVTITHIQGRGK